MRKYMNMHDMYTDLCFWWDFHLVFINCVHPVNPTATRLLLEAEVEHGTAFWENVALKQTKI